MVNNQGMVPGAVVRLAQEWPVMAVNTSLDPLPAKQFGPAEARHLLQRAGFGASPKRIAELAERGRDEAVRRLVHYETVEAPNLKPFDVDPDIVPYLTDKQQKVFRQARKKKKSKVIKKFRDLKQAGRKEDRQAFHRLQHWWLKRMAETPRPLEEKMTLLWHDHFATAYQKVKDTYLLYKQNRFLRRYASDSFAKLAHGIVRDPAMIQYLDNHRNRKHNPNENLGRELLELFTLGEGQYSERDIKEASRALTGYAYDDNKFVYRKNWHDKEKKVILGQRGRYDGDDLVNLLLRRKACSEFVAYKLYQHLVADVAPDAERMPDWSVRVMQQLAAELRRHDYDLKPVLTKLLTSQHFYDNAVVGKKIKSPVQLTVGTMRSMHTPMRDPTWLRRAMMWMGQELFQPPNVAGWPEGRAWINTSTLFVRQNLCAYLITGEYRGQRRVPKDQSPYEPGKLLSELDSAEPEPAVEQLLDTFVGAHVPAERRQPVLQLAKEKASPGLNGEALQQVLVAITAMPEYQLC
jgi:hypothetical protein